MTTQARGPGETFKHVSRNTLDYQITIERHEEPLPPKQNHRDSRFPIIDMEVGDRWFFWPVSTELKFNLKTLVQNHASLIVPRKYEHQTVVRNIKSKLRCGILLVRKT